MTKKYLLTIGIITLTIIGIQSCEKFQPNEPEDESVLDGPIEGLNSAEAQRFIRGDDAFNKLIFTAETGLGPIFIANSCVSCHPKDGKGHPSTIVTRFGQSDETGNRYLHLGGPQLQNRAIPGYQPETLPEGAPFARFMPPAVAGLGYLEFVSDETIIALTQPSSANARDGIAGRVNWIDIPAYIRPRPQGTTHNGRRIGRFGKKASVYSMLHQTVEALSQDIGIATLYNPIDVFTGELIDPELDNKTVNDLAFYLLTLKAPIPRDMDDPRVNAGKALFQSINCSGCHTPKLTTDSSPIASLSNQEFYPYTDMLLHDMGPDLDDGYTEGSAKTAEWRTAPLWGLGLSPDSQGGQYYLMHDGRARSIEEAIELHGGEASAPRDRFRKLSAADKEALLTFLQSL